MSWLFAPITFDIHFVEIDILFRLTSLRFDRWHIVIFLMFPCLRSVCTTGFIGLIISTHFHFHVHKFFSDGVRRHLYTWMFHCHNHRNEFLLAASITHSIHSPLMQDPIPVTFCSVSTICVSYNCMDTQFSRRVKIKLCNRDTLLVNSESSNNTFNLFHSSNVVAASTLISTWFSHDLRLVLSSQLLNWWNAAYHPGSENSPQPRPICCSSPCLLV